MKRFLSLLVVITIVLTGCSTKTKDEKATQVIEEKKEEKKDKTDEKKEKGEDKTDEGKIVDPITSNVSEQDKHLLNSWVIFLSSPYHYPTIEEKLDFNDPSTINTQFSYIIDYLEQSNSIQHDSDFKYAIPEELFLMQDCNYSIKKSIKIAEVILVKPMMRQQIHIVSLMEEEEEQTFRTSMYLR